jgi:hypothetical protein
MSPNRPEPKQVVAYIAADLYQTLVADADRQKRSISAQLHYIIERYYEARETEIRQPRRERVQNQA